MYKLIVFMLFFNASVYSFDVLEAVNINGTWQNDQGQFSGDRLKIYTEEVGLKSGALTIPLKKEKGKYHTSYKGIDFVYSPKQNSILEGIKKLIIDRATLIYHPKSLLQFQTEGITLAQDQGQQSLPKMSVRCKTLPKDKSLIQDALFPCLEVGALHIPLVTLNKFSGQKFSQAMDAKASIDKVEDVKVNIYQKRFTASLKAKFIFRLTAKISGSINMDNAKNQLIVHIEKASAGIFPVKRTLLKAIREANLDSIKVVGDRLFIQL